jgi:isoamylase
VFSAHARRIEFCLFDAAGRETARLDLPSRTGDIWHGLLPAAFGGAGTLYGYRVHGPYQPGDGHRFNPGKAARGPLRETLSKAASRGTRRCAAPSRAATGCPTRTTARRTCPSAASSTPSFDWGGVRAPSIPWRDTIIYELHVKGFTQRHPGCPSTCAASTSASRTRTVIDYLRKLGVTTVELMPVQSFVSEEFLVKKGLSELLGLQPARVVRPRCALCVVDPVVEFKTMVRALHDAGIEVVLDVVFNHTAEGNENGPTLSLRGFDNLTYYRLAHQNRAQYKNFTGCGNTVSFDDPSVRGLVLDCLRFWTDEMRVDGFRFDLATVVGRDPERLQPATRRSSPRCAPTRCSRTSR